MTDHFDAALAMPPYSLRQSEKDELLLAGLNRLTTRHYNGCTPYKRIVDGAWNRLCLLYTSPSPRDGLLSRMPSSA